MTVLFSKPNAEFAAQALSGSVCPICKGAQLLIQPDGTGKRCACVTAEAGEMRARSARIPERFLVRTFDTFKTKGLPAEAVSGVGALRSYATTFRSIATMERKGLLLTGGVGVGKTHLAVAILQEVLNDGSSGLFWNTVDFFQALRSCMQPGAAVTEDELLEQARRADLLVLDDLGAEKTSDWVLDRLYMLVNSRYQDDKPLIVTTNQNSAELEDRVTPRICSRLAEMCAIVKFAGVKDYRRSNMK